MNYKEMLAQTEEKIEMYLNDILTNNLHRSVKAEEYLMALCKARDYLKDKAKEENLKELFKINADMIKTDAEVQNEG